MTMFFKQGPSMAGSHLKDFLGGSEAILIIWLFVTGFGFMMATFFVLFGMDVLEVCLHTLRLHWVEFMKQFFEGKGYKYTPFSFNAVFEKEMDRSD